MSSETRKEKASTPHVTPPDVPLRRAFPWRRFFFGIVILVLGFALGLACAITFRHEIFRLMRPPKPSRRPSLDERLAEKIGLLPEQQARFSEIYDRHWSKMLEAARSQAPDIQNELTALEQEIAGMLNDDQKAEWKTATERMRFFVPIRLTIEANREHQPPRDGPTPEHGRGPGAWHGHRKERKR